MPDVAERIRALRVELLALTATDLDDHPEARRMVWRASSQLRAATHKIEQATRPKEAA